MEKRVAVLIDGDNISPKYAEYIRKEAERLGRIEICRLYGTINSPTVKSWYRVMPMQGITPMLQISYANGKSIADQALTIDAMDILHSGQIDVICLVSSDSDFTKLVYRIKEAGMTVIGMGEQKTNEALAKACDEFKVIDLICRTSKKEKAVEKPETVLPMEDNGSDNNEEIMEVSASINIPTEEEIIGDILEFLEEGWENLANVGIYLSKQRPGFDTRIYGYRNISNLIHSHEDLFEMKKVEAEDKIHYVVYVKKK